MGEEAIQVIEMFLQCILKSIIIVAVNETHWKVSKELHPSNKERNIFSNWSKESLNKKRSCWNIPKLFDIFQCFHSKLSLRQRRQVKLTGNNKIWEKRPFGRARESQNFLVGAWSQKCVKWCLLTWRHNQLGKGELMETESVRQAPRNPRSYFSNTQGGPEVDFCRAEKIK